MLHAVIMAGGAGTRFWPASRALLPKQLLDLAGGRSMIQATVGRLGDLVPPHRVLIVTNEQLVTRISAQLPELPPTAILGEPCKRDTAPCIALAASIIQKRDPHGTMAVMPSDHVIGPDDTFRAALRAAEDLVEQDPARIVTFGIRPTYPAESFGYIERGEQLDCPPAVRAFRVSRFREKPAADVAEKYLASGNFYWNAGIFVWKASTVLQSLQRFEPQMFQHIERIAASLDTPRFAEVLQTEFHAIQGKSIDYAVMERHEHVVVVEAAFDWDDVGGWQSLARTRGADADGNTVIGRHVGIRTEGSIVRTDKDHLVVTLGLKDTIVVHTPDATLVANKHDEEAIREVVNILKDRGWNEYL